MRDLQANLIVCKFGGTSLADAEQYRKVAEIIRVEPRRRVIVVSAPGRGKQGEPKITDLLIAADQGDAQEARVAFEAVRDRFQRIASDLGVGRSTSLRLERLSEQFSTKRLPRDRILSWGEWLSAHLLGDLLGWDVVDAVDVIRFNARGAFEPYWTYEKLSDAIGANRRCVIPGFYGSLPDGSIRTFERGGSDITGGIVAAALSASLYENWTDVSGVMQVDPRLYRKATPIQRLTYQQVRELAYMGASVLHHEAMQPVREKGIPIAIRNTDRPEDEGTRIEAAGSQETVDGVIGIAGKAGFTMVTVERSLMNDQIGVGRRVLAVFEQHGVAYEHTPTSIDAVSVVASSSALDGKLPTIVQQIRQELRPDRLETDTDLALISIVGSGGWNNPMRLSQMFWSLWTASIATRLIISGANTQSLIIGVKADQLTSAIQGLATNAFAG